MAEVVMDEAAEAAEDFGPEIMESLGKALMTLSGLVSGAIAGEIYQRVSSKGGTTTKGIENKFVQRTSNNTVIRLSLDDKGQDTAEMRADYLSTKTSLDKKLAQMAKSFGINVKNATSDIWKEVKKAWCTIMGFEYADFQLHWLDVTKTGDKAKTTAKKKEFDALKKALYDKGVLSEEAGASLLTGTWASPATLHTVFPFKGNVAQHIVDYYLNNYLQFSTEDATTIRNKINEYLTAHPDEGIFSVISNSNDFTYGSFSVNFASKATDYNIKIEGKPESGSPFLFGEITGLDHDMNQIKFNVSTSGTDYSPIGPADSSYIYPDKVRLTSISETTEHYPTGLYKAMYSSTRECVAPVFSNGVLQDKFVDHNGTEHTISGATDDYGVLIGYDGSNISTVTREAVSSSSSKFYKAFSLATITLDTTINVLKDYVGKTINEIIKELATSSDKPYVLFAYGMQSNKIVGLTDTVNFEKTDENAELPKENVDIMDQYANTWAKGATTVGDTYLQDGALVNGQETALPFSMDATATQTMAQAGTDVWDYAQSQPLPGAQTVAASVPATAPASISADLTVPTVVPIIPVATVLPEVLSGGSGAGLWQMYSPSASNIKAFGTWLWENPVEGLTAPGDTLKKLFQNPMDAIISLHRVYVTPETGGSKNIKVGFLDSGVGAPVITNRYVHKSMGSVTIKPVNRNFMDYEGVDMTIYLPFIGMRPLDTSVCMGATLTLTYNVDVLTGTCVAMLSVRKNNINGVIYQWVGSMFESVPVTSANMNSAIQGTLGLVGSAVTTVAGAVAGGPAGAAVGAAGLASSASGIHTNIQSCGSIGGTAGALASRSAYITLTIVQTYNPYNWKNVKGLPDNVTTSIGSQRGYIEGDNPTGYSGSMTQAEWNEFESLLAKGIYV
jgi:hypothetical protein